MYLGSQPHASLVGVTRLVKEIGQPAPVELGKVLAGRFLVRSQLGAGAFGTVYAADDLERHTTVAIKYLTRISANTIYRFKQEFRALSDLHHPNLIRLYQLFSQGDDWFFSMELLDGQRFDQFVLGPSHRSSPISTLSEQEIPAAPQRQRTLPDLQKLRPALGQLTAGIQALHASGVLHRDLKPANVLVTPEGRVVLLDFGLATGSDQDSQQSVLGMVMGTPTYMAPEQASGRPTSEASDWYALGVMLYEVLWGHLPFAGTVQDVLSAKLSFATWRWPPPQSGAEDLVDLCRALLNPDPSKRPSGATIAEVVGAAAFASTARAAPLKVPFLGRARELATLHEAFSDVSNTGSIVLQVSGPSGVGKSSLVRRFVESVGPDCVPLHGRCYDRESVPYKALDGVVDALTRYIGRLSLDEASLLVPREAKALCRLFPVFGRLPLIADQPERGRSSSPQQERRRGFVALREMLARIGDRRRLVVSIDDFQWGDIDSLEPLSTILAPPDAPRLLLILAYRSEDADASPVLKALRQPAYLASFGEVRSLYLAPLDNNDAVELARQLLPPEQSGRAEELARESGGSPFLLSELVRTHGTHGSATKAVSLNAVMRARFVALSEPARRLLEVIAVAGRPLPRHVAYRAAGLLTEISEPATAELVRERLVRHAAAEDSLIETFHDRIRETIVASLAVDALQRHHGSVALALESSGAVDPEAIAEHYRLAGNTEHARPAAVRAAERAADALAFERAAALYNTARHNAPPDERRLLTSKLAEMLVYAGRGRAAAEAYIEAMSGAAPNEAKELLRRAAEQLLRCGAITEGIGLARELLAEHGLSYPESRNAVLASAMWQKARLKLRGHRFVERSPQEIDADAVIRTDVCWTLSACLIAIDVIRAADYQTRHLRYALDLGEPYRIARGFALEAVLQAMEGGRARDRAEGLAVRASEIAARIDHPHALGWAKSSLAIVDWCAARWRKALQRSTEALTILRTRSPESIWEIALLEIWFKNRSLFFLGELEEFVAEATSCNQRAEDRGDQLTLTTSQSVGMANVFLIAGKPQEARTISSQGISLWDDQDAWRFQHQEDLRAQVLCDLYEGDAKRAIDRIDKNWDALKGSMLLRAENERIQSLSLYALASLHAGDARAFARWQRKLAREKNPWGKTLQVALHAGRLALTHDDAAATAYEEAAIQFETLDMPLYAAAARRRRGEILGGEQGTTLVREVDTLLRQKGVAEPERWARLLVA